MRTNLLLSGAIAAAFCAAPPAGAQVASDTGAYEREVFRYERTGRRDPFRSLLGTTDMGVRLEDLTLLGVLHNPDPRQSVAVLSHTGSDRRLRLRVGERIGGITVVAIHPRRVDVVVDELGVARRETLHLRADSQQGDGS